MPTIVRRVDGVGPAGLEPRRSLVTEVPDGDGFSARPGLVRDYRRTVVVTPDEVVQTVSYRVDLPLLGWLVALPLRRELGRIGPDRTPWWGPPDVLDADAWAAVAALTCLGALVGYLATLITQTITYVGQEFHVGTGGQGVALAVVRGDIVITLGLVALADRRGRRSTVLLSSAVACILTAATAASPSLPWFAALQVLSKGFVTAVTIASAILLAEAMPKGARAWGLGVLAMASAVGAGVCVAALPITAVGVWAWRLLFVGGLAWLLLLRPVARHLPESRRFESVSHHAHAPARRGLWGRRLILLAVANFCFQAFVTPASQFQNQYLRTERGFSPARISLFTILTVTPGAIGIVVGGRLADTRGRRRVAVVAVGGAAVGAVVAFWAAGWPMWLGSTVANLLGAATIPALAVYGPELFRTDHRGAANGLITGAGRVGGIVGLLAIGGLDEVLGRFGPAFAVASTGPLVVIALLVVAFPETAHRSLEELNPEDEPLTADPDAPT